MIRCPALVVLACLLSVEAAAAQDGAFSRVAVDSTAVVEMSVAEPGDGATAVAVDAVATIGLGAGFDVIVRPWMQKLGNSDEWNRQIWLATLRYQRTGRVGLRVDGGLIASPVGYANLMLRPQLNPTIALPSSLFVPLPNGDAGGPRTTLLGVLYPYGISATVSGTRWDARAAVIDTSPLRMRRVFADTNPPRFANVVVGGGVTPIVGLRIGASVTHGGWQRAGESPGVSRDLQATVVTVESSFAFRHTEIGAEFVRNSIELADGRRTPSGWFVQARQTLSPRWFAAGRVERITATAASADDGQRDHFTGVESVLGYRITPEVTIRGGHRVRQGFGAAPRHHAASVSLAWWHEWQ